MYLLIHIYEHIQILINPLQIGPLSNIIIATELPEAVNALGTRLSRKLSFFTFKGE